MGNVQSQEGETRAHAVPSQDATTTPDNANNVPKEPRAQSMISIAADDLNQEGEMSDDNQQEGGNNRTSQNGTSGSSGHTKRRSQTSGKKTHQPYSGPCVPTIIRWRGGGEVVYVTGSFSRWKKKIQLLKSEDYTVLLQLRPGTQRFKFLVDGIWCCSSDFPTATDAEGNLYNYLEVEANEKLGASIDERLSQVHTDLPMEEKSESEQYSTEIPAFLTSNTLQELKLPKPPSLPPHLEKCILNSNTAYKEDQSVLPNPNHVLLNHLAAANTQLGVLALSATTRYHRKYVTTAMFKNFDV
ncbi:serine/threonine protein kinase AMPK (beta) regulatory subunit Amk2 [Schizosaccharomyces pombe]|uniref:5'-AMP-activated protein kinase subunit beta n=1 Tax=Schizosaccharomyces pombe (strain 972 / ATCC 24843) TaxID=284812 RepID=AAKB_SCHPO|nr:AMP-activated protein kinase beta subunit Amk2 [Schizosaccharomyces pombe]P78789.2 RecName: Full=5'-AMP-activated protein kinase subunit beta; Short=AMPK subunit beta [Schizosaccharomyces pombe 972h-]CAA22634.1 AMP-activated protein kinase beta subunit Amk2 [Schizosaccharomyces pombe]|eukprot:NP_588485.1 AMP-activated protein kinase beta subunit Amk2 [Schizosaccharomyces pombe]